MIALASNLLGRQIQGADEPSGFVCDLYFRQHTGEVCFLVVRIFQDWLHAIDVLLSPDLVQSFRNDHGPICVSISRRQIEASKRIEHLMPLAKAFDQLKEEAFGLIDSERVLEACNTGTHFKLTVAEEDEDEILEDMKLVSFKSILCASVQCENKPKGHVENLLLQTTTWKFTHLLVDIHNWLPEELVILDYGFLKRIVEDESAVRIGITAEGLTQAPRFDPKKIKEKNYVKDLQDYYRKLKNDL